MGKVQKPFLFFLALFYSGLTGLQAQKVNVDVFKYSSALVIDGIEEEAWDAVDPVKFTLRLGQEISGISKPGNNKLDVSYLLKGIFVIKIYKGEKYIGAAKITKI
jgi:hypothetical protein